MATLNLPLSVTYETQTVTPIADIIAALQGADIAIQDAVSLLPSLIRGVHIERSQVNVLRLSQESPLRELFLVALLVTFQDESPAIRDSTDDRRPFQGQHSGSYDSIVTIVTMIVLFYGAAFLKDAAVKAVQDGALRRKLNNMIAQLARATGKTEDEVRAILVCKV